MFYSEVMTEITIFWLARERIGILKLIYWRPNKQDLYMEIYIPHFAKKLLNQWKWVV